MQRAFRILVVAGALASSACADEPDLGADAGGFEGHYYAAIDAFNQGRLAESRRGFEAAARMSPDLPGPWRWLGRIARIQGSYQECIQFGERALAINPSSPHAPDVQADIAQCREHLE